MNKGKQVIENIIEDIMTGDRFLARAVTAEAEAKKNMATYLQNI